GYRLKNKEQIVLFAFIANTFNESLLCFIVDGFFFCIVVNEQFKGAHSLFHEILDSVLIDKTRQASLLRRIIARFFISHDYTDIIVEFFGGIPAILRIKQKGS